MGHVHVLTKTWGAERRERDPAIAEYERERFAAGTGTDLSMRTRRARRLKSLAGGTPVRWMGQRISEELQWLSGKVLPKPVTQVSGSLLILIGAAAVRLIFDASTRTRTQTAGIASYADTALSGDESAAMSKTRESLRRSKDSLPRNVLRVARWVGSGSGLPETYIHK